MSRLEEATQREGKSPKNRQNSPLSLLGVSQKHQANDCNIDSEDSVRTHAGLSLPLQSLWTYMSVLLGWFSGTCSLGVTIWSHFYSLSPSLPQHSPISVVRDPMETFNLDSLHIMSDWESLHLLPFVATGSLCGDYWTRHQSMSIAEYP